MSKKTEAGTQTLDNSSDTIELRSRRELEMETQGIGASADELTLRSFDERIKKATDPILRRIEELCALSVGRTELESAGNTEVSGSRRDNASVSPSRLRHDRDTRNPSYYARLNLAV